MILFIGQVPASSPTASLSGGDYRQMFGPMSKWVAQIERADRVHEYVSRAFHLAMSGRRAGGARVARGHAHPDASVPDVAPYQAVQASPSAGDLEKLRACLRTRNVRSPYWSTVWTREAAATCRRSRKARASDLLLVPLPRPLRQPPRPLRGRRRIGINPKLAERVRTADVLLVIGARLGEMTTGAYTLVEPPRPKQKLVHVHAGAEELGRVYQGELLINSGMPQIAAALKGMKLDGSAWRAWREQARADYLEWTKPTANRAGFSSPRSSPGCASASRGRHHRERRGISRLDLALLPLSGPAHAGRATNGSMGYGVPAGVAAKSRIRNASSSR